MHRILMLVHNRVGRGTYWRAFGLAQELASRGHELTLVAISDQARWKLRVKKSDRITLVESPDLFSGPLRSGWDPYDTLRRILWTRQGPFDIIHAFEARPIVIFPALFARRRHQIPLVLDWCDWFGSGGSVEERPNPAIRTILRPVETFFERSFRTHADGTTVINTVLRQMALDLGVPEEQICLLPNGIDIDHFQPQDRQAVRQRLNLPPEVHFLAYTGTIFERDAALMAKTFDLIHANQPDTRLLLIGYCNAPLEEMVQSPEAVMRTGTVSYEELADYLAASDIGWLPLADSGANRGRFPMKLNDFLATGLPVVATDVGDVGNLLREEQIGRVVPDQPEPLAQAVLDLLADKEAREKSGRHARHIAETSFAWRYIGDLAEQFYNTILEDSTSL